MKNQLNRNTRFWGQTHTSTIRIHHRYLNWTCYCNVYI